MSEVAILDLSSSLSGKTETKEALSLLEQYEKYILYIGGTVEERKANYLDMTQPDRRPLLCLSDLLSLCSQPGLPALSGLHPVMRGKLRLHSPVWKGFLNGSPFCAMWKNDVAIPSPTLDRQVDTYYNLVSSFYEYGWGESFHFASRWKGESLQESKKRHEQFIALQLGLKRGQKVLDVGCGIGGPLREIARFSATSITGLNINNLQISRGTELNRIAGVDKTCNFVKADFMKMPFPDNTYDAIYAIEATCHAPDMLGCYKEIYRVLKPGQCFAAYELCLTDYFDPNNQEHQKIKEGIAVGNGLANMWSTRQCFEALKLAGFEIVWEKDLAVDSPLPWYLPLDTSHLSLSSARLTAPARCITNVLVKTLESVGLAPKGSQKIQSLLQKTGEWVLQGGRKEICTPLYFFLAQKPHSGSLES